MYLLKIKGDNFMKKTNKVICVILPVIVLIVVFCLLWGIFSNNINASNLEKLGTFVTLKQENDGRYYGVEISGSSNHGPAVYEFNNGYLLKKDYNNQNVKDSYTVRVINDTAFVVKDEDEFEDMTLTIVNYDSSTGILELSENDDIIYCYPYDKVDLDNIMYEHDGMYVFKRYYVNFKGNISQNTTVISEKVTEETENIGIRERINKLAE